MKKRRKLACTAGIMTALVLRTAAAAFEAEESGDLEQTAGVETFENEEVTEDFEQWEENDFLLLEEESSEAEQEAIGGEDELREEVPEKEERSTELFEVEITEEKEEGETQVLWGECGKGILWSVDVEKGRLTLSGKGALPDYRANEIQPWYRLADLIEEVQVGEGIIAIGDFAFEGMNYVRKIVLPASLQEIHTGALRGLGQLETIEINVKNEKFTAVDQVLFSKDKRELICYPQMKQEKEYRIPQGTKELAMYAFYGQEHLETLLLPDSVEQIGDDAFAQCAVLTDMEMYQ